MQFGEDNHRIRKDASAANLGLVRRTALNLLQQDTSNKISIQAVVDLSYREKILFGKSDGAT
ncbi:transposase [Candidatus Regiella insecticola]|uniref:Transposase n=1 Tax=Candidatus Regiella insecticola TaxID=138073 RepID=A0A6L2ZPN8_9ENTR|nr:transposase [Candidatus Regiella insecticola]